MRQEYDSSDPYGRNHGYTGSVTVDGRELSDIQESSPDGPDHSESVTTAISFKGTVEDNLRMGKPNATEEEMQEALEKVNLWGFLQAQQGLATPILERGSNFSGGQCQRLAIARALLHDTPVYIFDEATSNIDAESEEMIMDVIHTLAETKTIILISHRLANVVKSDRIYMMKEGGIAETGTHEALMGAEWRLCKSVPVTDGTGAVWKGGDGMSKEKTDAAKSGNTRRSGIRIMGQLIGLVKPAPSGDDPCHRARNGRISVCHFPYDPCRIRADAYSAWDGHGTGDSVHRTGGDGSDAGDSPLRRTIL